MRVRHDLSRSPDSPCLFPWLHARLAAEQPQYRPRRKLLCSCRFSTRATPRVFAHAGALVCHGLEQGSKSAPDIRGCQLTSCVYQHDPHTPCVHRVRGIKTSSTKVARLEFVDLPSYSTTKSVPKLASRPRIRSQSVPFDMMPRVRQMDCVRAVSRRIPSCRTLRGVHQSQHARPHGSREGWPCCDDRGEVGIGGLILAIRRDDGGTLGRIFVFALFCGGF
jgi:hypothetical protein